ncbi:MAG: TatD family hydrolase [Pseudomonadota bacterium]
MPFPLVDIGINLTDSSFAPDRAAVIDAARQAGVGTLILTGTDLVSSQQALALCAEYGDGLYCTAGVHPHYAKEWSDQHREEMLALTRHDRVVAIGETGLDYNRNLSPPEQQRRVFEQQLALAADTGLPLFLHERDAADDQVALLRRFRNRISGGVAHCFTGTAEVMQQYLALDLHIGITGWICDERRGLHLREQVKEIPLNRLLLETDGPYLLPRDLQPKPKSRRNEPKYLPHIATVVAECVGMSPEELAAVTTANAEGLFGLKSNTRSAGKT